jgi:hypothetical protein
MGKITDRFFIRPHELFAASEVNVYDAMNLVVYAKLPLKKVLTGGHLVAGFLRLDESGIVKMLMGQTRKDQLLDQCEGRLDSLRYPVEPSQYEPLLESMVESKATFLPFFFHEHHQLVDQRVIPPQIS